MRLPPRGTSVDELICTKCGKTLGECKPKDCTDPDCPNKGKKKK